MVANTYTRAAVWQIGSLRLGDSDCCALAIRIASLGAERLASLGAERIASLGAGRIASLGAERIASLRLGPSGSLRFAWGRADRFASLGAGRFASLGAERIASRWWLRRSGVGAVRGSGAARIGVRHEGGAGQALLTLPRL